MPSSPSQPSATASSLSSIALPSSPSPPPADSAPPPVAVVPNLYVGDRRLAASRALLQSIGISHIVNATVDVRCYFQHDAAFTYLRCPCNDSEVADLSPYFSPACAFISSALSSGHGVLVHCQRGVSRSAALVLAFLVRCQSPPLPLSAAYVLLRTARPEAKPNASFLRQLMHWERQSTDARATQQQPTAEAAALRADQDDAGEEEGGSRAKRQKTLQDTEAAAVGEKTSPPTPSPPPVKRYGPSPPPPPQASSRPGGATATAGRGGAAAGSSGSNARRRSSRLTD